MASLNPISMKGILRILFLLGMSLSFNQCMVDPCEETVCLNRGTCDDGNCLCKPGFTGENCQTEIRAAMVGTYYGNKTTATSQTGTYLSVVRSNAGNEFLFADIDGKRIYITVVSSTNFTIGNDTYFSQDYEYEGTGFIDGNTIYLNVHFTSGEGTDFEYTGEK